jgi:hypothetical protein
MGEATENRFLFQPVQRFGLPKIFPPASENKIPAAAQFVVPGLRIGKDKPIFVELARSCGSEVWDVSIDSGHNTKTQEQATLFTLAFYIPHLDSQEEIGQSVQAVGRLLVERYLGLISFFGGIKCAFAHLQFTVLDQPDVFRQILPMANRAASPTVGFTAPSLPKKDISENVFSALFWLRRGLAERDPIETFSSLMVSIQILARELVDIDPIPIKCTSCGHTTHQKPGITSLVRELTTKKLGADPELCSRLWKARNSIVAHGGKTVTAEVLLELTDLKFEAIDLVFRGMNLALGIPLESGPKPNRAFYITDAFMYLD